MSTMKYTAINIGPIISTISMARKPRELWAASYLFSHLMECIIGELKKKCGVDKIISPACPDKECAAWLVKNVGLYPDRVFIEGEVDVKEVLDMALGSLAGKVNIEKDILKSYVNTMYVSVEQPESPIKELNLLLDATELFNRPMGNDGREAVLKRIQQVKDSPLFGLAGLGNTMKVKMLSEIASHRLSLINPRKWAIVGEEARKKELEEEKERRLKGNSEPVEIEEDCYFRWIKEQFPDEFRSHDKYICVVQADGDNMGSIVSALPTEKVKELSEVLLRYGCEVSRLIEKYGGMPVYAGGDDLLFLAPVVSGYQIEDGTVVKQTIFELLDGIDKCYQSVNDKVKALGCSVDTSVSYGLSISYYKYPLYEALESARELLFQKAKNIKGKNAIAWCLRKHSGSGFVGEFSKLKRNERTDGIGNDVNRSFKTLMDYPEEDKLVAAVAHKLKVNEPLLEMLRKEKKAVREERMIAFYKKEMEEANAEKESYIGNTRSLLNALLECYEEDTKVTTGQILEQMYGMLRTAKFINGEEDNDE